MKPHRCLFRRWGKRAVPIRPFLDGEFFEQESIDTMSQALADACATLGLKDKQDAAVGLLARRIVDEARAGVRDRSLLKAAAIKGLGPHASDERVRPGASGPRA
jgi:hypothetical protein